MYYHSSPSSHWLFHYPEVSCNPSVISRHPRMGRITAQPSNLFEVLYGSHLRLVLTPRLAVLSVLYYATPQSGMHVHFAAYVSSFSHPSNIFLRTPNSVPFSNAAATLSLSPSCLLTCSAVLCVPSLIRTSTLKRGGRACSSRTRTPRPITVAREQWVMVGVIRTVSVVRGDAEPFSGKVGVRWISGRLTTERDPSVRGCSGSEIGEMRSVCVSALII